METDTESEYDTFNSNQEETDSSDNNELETESVQASPNGTMWDRIQKNTWSSNPDFWSKLLAKDVELFRMRFKEFFIESCKKLAHNIQ